MSDGSGYSAGWVEVPVGDNCIELKWRPCLPVGVGKLAEDTLLSGELAPSVVALERTVAAGAGQRSGRKRGWSSGVGVDIAVAVVAVAVAAAPP